MEAIKNLVVHALNRAVSQYIRRNHIKVIAVAGSMGKTSTTGAIRTVLSQKYTVHIPRTTYNTNRSVHLELFDLPFASSTLGWVKMVLTVLRRARGKAPYEVVVIEIGTDHPGELQTFAWLKPEIGVLTAISPEHMEFFKTVEAVAKEELSIISFCKTIICNANTVDRKYVSEQQASAITWYGRGQAFAAANYRLRENRVQADFELEGLDLRAVNLQVLGEHSLDSLAAAATVARRMGLEGQQITAGLAAFQPVKGRMQRLDGRQNATLLDDTYNASPPTVKAALDVLAQFTVPQRIAVLGSMNEMGEYSPQAHQEVGGYCDPAVLDLVVTIGKDANQYLAPAAEKRGCTVLRCDSPYQAGKLLLEHLKPGAAVLAKGSQNGVFAEESLKAVLADPSDAAKLTRQSEYWMARKRRQFADAPAA